jgi:NitT/TauT family transport system substrate-binding protein
VSNLISLFDLDEVRNAVPNVGDTYELELNRNASSPDTLNQMAGGNLDMGVLTTVSYANAVLQEAVPGNVNLIAMDFYDGHPDYFGFTIYSAPDSDITEPADLEGGTHAVNATGTVIHSVYARALQSAGISSDDVEFTELEFPTFDSAISDGRVDTAIYLALFAVSAREKDFTEVCRTQDFTDGAYPAGYVAASNDAIDNKSDAFSAFGEDYVAMIDYIFNNRSTVVSAAAEQFDLPEQTLDAFYLTNRDYYREDATIDMDAHQRTIDELVELDFLNESFDVTEYTTNEFVDI